MTDPAAPRQKPAKVQQFQPTNGRASGYLGLACAAVVLVLALAARSTGQPLGVAILAVLGALLVWVILLRPAVWTTERDLVMRSMFHTDTIPLRSIERVAVGQVLAVFAAGRRFVSAAIGYSTRQTVRMRTEARTGRGTPRTAADTYQVFVEERLVHLAQEDRDRYADGETAPRRSIAWPEIAGIAVLVVAFLVWLAL
jgi:Flp pilus assembly protein TadB